VNQSTDINPNSLLQLRFHEWLTVCVVVTRVHVAELFEVLDCEWLHAQMSVMVHCICGCKQRKQVAVNSASVCELRLSWFTKFWFRSGSSESQHRGWVRRYLHVHFYVRARMNVAWVLSVDPFKIDRTLHES
jgi:protein tyrosine phosphatase